MLVQEARTKVKGQKSRRKNRLVALCPSNCVTHPLFRLVEKHLKVFSFIMSWKATHKRGPLIKIQSTQSILTDHTTHMISAVETCTYL